MDDILCIVILILLFVGEPNLWSGVQAWSQNQVAVRDSRK